MFRGPQVTGFNGGRIAAIAAVALGSMIMAGALALAGRHDAAYLPVVGLTLVALSIGTLIEPLWMLIGILFIAATAGLGREEAQVVLGSFHLTISGALWGWVTGMALLVLVQRRRLEIPRVCWTLSLFVSWVAARMLLGPWRSSAAKDLLFYSLPVLLIMVGRALAARDPERFDRWFGRAIVGSLFVPIAVYVIGSLGGAITWTATGPKGIVGPRGVALFAGSVLPFVVAMGRYSPRGHRARWGVLAGVAVALIVATLSRASLVAAVGVLVVGVSLRPGRIYRLIPAVALALGLSALIVAEVPALNSRFFYSTPRGAADAIELFNTAGRDKMWAITVRQALARPVEGWGVGSSREAVAAVFPSKDVSEYQPHNEYLQVWHDLGAVGLLLFLSAYVSILRRSYRDWSRAEHLGDTHGAAWSLAAMLSLSVLLLTGVVDNTFHYAFAYAVPMLLVGRGRVVRRQANVLL